MEYYVFSNLPTMGIWGIGNDDDENEAKKTSEIKNI